MTPPQNIFWTAFSSIGATRRSGFSAPDRLQISDIVLYALAVEEDPEEMLHVVLKLDDVWMSHWHDEHPS